MCWTIVAQALATKAAATTAAGAAMTAAGGAAAVGGTALTASGTAQAALATTLSSAAFVANTAGLILQFKQQADLAEAMGKAAHSQYQREQAQLGERARQEMVKFQIERDQLSRNAAVGIAKTRTEGTAQGLAGPDDRIVDFVNRADEAAGIDRAVHEMRIQNLNERASQSEARYKVAYKQVASATSTEAWLGLGMNIMGAYADSYSQFGAVPFESQESYAARLGVSAAGKTPTVASGNTGATPIPPVQPIMNPSPQYVPPPPKRTVGPTSRYAKQAQKRWEFLDGQSINAQWDRQQSLLDTWDFVQTRNYGIA